MAETTAHTHPTKQPKGLYVLFGAEAWERFSYYGMRALLVLYMTHQLNFSREEALTVYAIYTGLVYLTPFFGGILADKLLGSRKAVLIGGVVMAAGHLAMAFPNLLHYALGLLIVGNGFFKPNISTIVGGLYEENDPRRDGGFTIFYMGINLGAFFSPLVCGTLGEQVGWHWGFSAAAVGMLFGLGTFVAFQRLLGTAGYPPDMGEVEAGTSLRTKDWRDVGIWIVGSLIGVQLVLWSLPFLTSLMAGIPTPVKLGVGVLLILATLFGVIGGAAKDGKEATHRTLVILILGFFVIFFWMGFEQAGGTMTLFADEQTDRHIIGSLEMPASWFQSVNPFFIFLLAPIFSKMWLRWDESKFQISTPTKMAMGLFFLAGGFGLLYIGQQLALSTDSRVAIWWLIGVYFIHTVGELFLSPIGLSMVTKLSVPRMVSMMMGVWFTSSAVANYLAGKLESIVHDYHVPLFGFLIGSSVGAGVLLLAVTPLMKKWMHGKG